MNLKSLFTAVQIALAAMLLAFAPIAPAAASQSGCVVPTTGPSTFGTVVSTYLNPCFAALLSNSSGATAPASPTTYQLWVDTSTTPKTVKIYDGASWLALATVDTSGHLLALNASTIKLLNSSSGTTTITPPTTGTNALTLPAGTDTLVGKATTDTLTNKSISGSTNTLTAIPLTTAVTGTLPVANGGTKITSLGSGIATWWGTPSSANLRAALTDETGTLAAYFQGGDLGTPSAGVLTNATGLPIATGVTGLGSGVAAALATPSSANWRAAYSDETGTGAAYFQGGDIGTPSAGVGTNLTGVPIGSGISGLASGAATWLATPSSANFASLITDESGTGPVALGTVTSAATASTIALRDSNANISANAFIGGYATTVTAAGTTTLTVSSPQRQYFTGSTTQNVDMPVTSTLALGQSWTVVNNSSGAVTARSSGGNTILVVAAGNTGIFTAISTSGTTAASWSSTYISSGAGTGTVTSVSCGTGLTGGTITTTGTCNVDLGVTVQAYNATLAAVATDPSILASQQLARNGSMAIAQRSMPTADNTYSLDGWRLEIENSNGVVITQDTADVPTGAGYAAKLVVGSGNNGKFGLFSPIENRDMLKLRSGVASLLVPLKATAGLLDTANKLCIALLAFAGTADSVATDPISSWGAAGTNPTLATNWSYAGYSCGIGTTSWADYKLENVSVSGSATNVAIFAWSEDRGTTTTTDILRIGGKVTLTQGAAVAAPIILVSNDEAVRSTRYYRIDWAGGFYTATNGFLYGQNVNWGPPMRTAPSISKLADGSIDGFTGMAGGDASITGFRASATANATGSNKQWWSQFASNADL
jgi:hypothetical protein